MTVTILGNPARIYLDGVEITAKVAEVVIRVRGGMATGPVLNFSPVAFENPLVIEIGACSEGDVAVINGLRGV